MWYLIYAASVLVLIILGFVSVRIDMKACRHSKLVINDYLANLSVWTQKKSRNRNCRKEELYLRSEASHMCAAIKEYPNGSCIDNLLTDIQHNLFFVKDDCNLVYTRSLQVLNYYDDKEKELSRQRLNPFTMFFRGVSLLLRFIFGYPLKHLNPSFSFEGRFWKVFTFVTGLASLASLVIPFFIK